jgi:DNA-binding PucR family transcriptional regulator
MSSGKSKPETLDGTVIFLDWSAARITAFVDSELGPIEKVGKRSERLLGVLEVFLQHGQRMSSTSTITGRHRDTVRRYIGEVEDLLGFRVEERSAELLWALRLRRKAVQSSKS